MILICGDSQRNVVELARARGYLTGKPGGPMQNAQAGPSNPQPPPNQPRGPLGPGFAQGQAPVNRQMKRNSTSPGDDVRRDHELA